MNYELIKNLKVWDGKWSWKIYGPSQSSFRQISWLVTVTNWHNLVILESPTCILQGQKSLYMACKKWFKSCGREQSWVPCHPDYKCLKSLQKITQIKQHPLLSLSPYTVYFIQWKSLLDPQAVHIQAVTLERFSRRYLNSSVSYQC